MELESTDDLGVRAGSATRRSMRFWAWAEDRLLTLWWMFAAVGFVVVAWPYGWSARVATTVPALLAIAATAPVPTGVLRWVRVVAGTWTGAVGALVSISLGAILTGAEADPTLGALEIALVLSLATSWIADHRYTQATAAAQRRNDERTEARLVELVTQLHTLVDQQHERDELADRRHQELLEAIRATDARPPALRKLRNLLGVPDARD